MSYHRSIFVIAFCMVLFTVSAWALAAGFPPSISYQGTMVDKSGVVVTGNKNIKFSLYSTTGGTTPFWNETHSVMVTNGQFSAQLGSIVPLDAGKFRGRTYLGLAIGSDFEMAPRQQMVSVPYAMNGSPTGSVIAFAGMVEPSGWLLCDGRSLSRSDYPELFSVIGTAHGAVDSTHFNLPDYRGRFLRGVDYSPNTGESGRDPDRSSRAQMFPGGIPGNNVGSVQNDAYQYHTHYLTTYYGTTDLGSHQTYAQGFGNQHLADYIDLSTKSSNGRSATETRSKNAYVNWIIKY